MKQALVVGLGQFGLGLAKSLAEAGADVIAADLDPKRVELALPWVSKAVCIDATSEEDLSQLKPEIRDVCICATGDQSKEVGIICTALFSQMGAKRIIARANDDLHARILKMVGAHEVVNPEWDFGARFAPRVLSENVLGEMLLDTELVVSELIAPEHLWSKSLLDLNLRGEAGITVIAIRSHQTGQIKQANATEVIQPGDILITASSRSAIQNLCDGGKR